MSGFDMSGPVSLVCRHDAGHPTSQEFRFGAPSSEKKGPRSEAPGPPEASRNQGSSGKRGRSEGDDGHPRLALGVPELLPPHPLRLIIIGHNPSAHAWRTGESG